jgi:hypothetical protein
VAHSQSGLRRITTTTEEGLSLNPSLSGDGLHIAFESTEDIAHAGGSSFFRAIRADVSSDPPSFIQMGGTRAPAPAISQDGSRIAFASRDNPLGTNQDGNSEIFLFNGTSLRQITNTSPGNLTDRVRNGNFQPSISDDGRLIAFASNRDLVGLNADANLEIFIYDSLTQGFTQLTNSLGTTGATDAKISGNGARVAYIRDNGASVSTQRDLILFDRPSGTAQVAAQSVPGIALTYGRAISDDGTRVVFAAQTTGPSATQVFLFDGRSLNLIRPITFLDARTTDVPLHPTISGDGSRIAFATRRNVIPGNNQDSGVELYTFDIPTGLFAQVTDVRCPDNKCPSTQATATAEVVSSLNDNGSVIAFNFPRLLSGAVAFEELGNNSEIYMTATAARAPFGNLTILNGASFGHEPATTKAVAPNSIAVALGGDLANSTEQSQRQADGTFPRNVGGTTVTVNGRPAQIFFVSPAQVNFLVPPETEMGTADVIVTNANGFQTRGTVAVLRAAPGVFTFKGDGTGEGVILDAVTLLPGPFDPSNGQRRLIVFATGVRGAAQTTVTIGGRVVTVEAVMASPNMPGLDEIHLLLPADLRGAGTVELFVKSDGRDSNPVNITLTGEARRDVVINEVLADPPDGPTGDANHDGTRDGSQDEFIEIVNATASDIDISNFELLARGTSGSQDTLRHKFAQGTILPAGGAIVVFGGGSFDPVNPAFGGAQIVKASTGGLSLVNGGGVVTLRDTTGAVVSLFSYGGSTNLNADANQSLTRSPDVTGGFVLHTAATGSEGRIYSPGTRVDGSPFITPAIARIEVSPATASIFVGQSQQFTAKAFDASGQELSGVIFIWQTSNTAIATVNQNGLATGVAEGTAEIRAAARGVQSAPATLTVNPVERVLTRIEVSPPTANIPVGGAQSFTAHAFDQFNNEIAGVTFIWSSSDSNIATIDQTGLATGTGQGTVTITASVNNVNGTATLNVTPPTLVINEVLADPPGSAATDLQGDANQDNTRGSADDEFVELVNSTAASLNISGWTLRTRATGGATETVRHTFVAGQSLPAGEAIVVFGGGGFDPANPIFGCAQVLKASSGGLSLTNGGLSIIIRDAAGNLITQFTFGGTSGLNGDNDQSLTRSPDITGGFVLHTTASGAGGRRFSPGTRVNATPFGSCSAHLTSVTISPPSSSIVVGQSTQFSAQAFDQFGNPLAGAAITFTSDNITVATVDSVTTDPATGIATATVTGHNQGTAHITAQANDGTTTVTSSQATLTVNPLTPVLTSVSISPPSATIDTGQVQQFTAQALDQFNQPIGGVTITFASNNTAVATVDLISQTSSTGSASASVTGHANGSAEIRATADNGTSTVTSSPATLTVAHVINAGDVLISEFRFHGPSGANDEFIELYNRTTAAIDISGYKIFRSNSAGTTALTATIPAGKILGPGCHYLLANTGYTGSVSADQTYNTGVTDDGGIALTIPSGTATTSFIDQVGLSTGSAYKEGTTLSPLTTNVNQSYERKPGGASGNSTDTNNNASDFFLNAGSSNPQNLSSGCLDLMTADLSISKTDSPDPVITGSDVTYTINVTNNGPGTAQSVVVTDDLTGTANIVSCSSTGNGQCSGTGNNRTITFSSLSSGASATITLVATANGAGGTTITNTATVTSATADANAGNNSSTATTNVQSSTPLPTLSINDVLVAEGDSATKTVSFNVTLSASSTQTVTVAYATSSASPATAIAGTDYQSTSGTLTFNPGETGKPITVTINGDTLVEPDETFFVNLSGATNATIADNQGQGTITNDDTANLVVSQLYGGGNNSGASYQHDFIEIFNRGTSTVDFSVTPYSVQYASAGANFGASKTDLTIGTIAPRHYFLIQEAGGITNGIALPAPDATGTIAMGNTSGKVALIAGTSSLPAAICPGDDGTAPFNPNNATIADFAGYGSVVCYEGAGPAPAPSNTTADFRKAGGCTDTNDNAADFFVFAPNPRNSNSPVNNCSAASTPNLTINDVTVTEGNSGTVTATFTVSLSAPANGADVTFDIATQNNTAVSGSDYVAKSLTNQIIPAGQQTYTFTVTVNGDTAIEADETFFVNVTNVSGANVTDGQGVGTIHNDDLPALSINDVTQNEGNNVATTFTFTVHLSAPAPATVTFDIATADATAHDGNPAGEDNDYAAKSLTAQTIPAGQQDYNFAVTVNGDLNIEPNETFLVNVTNVSGANVTDGQGIGTIQNDDSPALSINDIALSEGDSGTKTFTFTVTSSLPAPSGGITFDIATADGTAQDDNPISEDNDYVAKSLTAQTITTGQQTYTFDVTVNGDTIVESNETFFVNLTNVSNANVSDAQGQGTITNDDTANLVISQIYGGGGNSGATYTHDFVEIFNRGTTTVNFALTPYSIQYAGAASNFGSNLTIINSGTIAPGRYFLVQEFAPASPAGVALPSPDVTGSINLATSGGKVALVDGTAAVNASSCPGDDLSTPPTNPSGNNIVDFVGYGNTASCYEGAGPAPAHSNTTTDFRKAGGCTDTGNNTADFLVAPLHPRNTSSPTNNCVAGAAPNLTIDDLTVTEGNSGTVTATFTVTLSSPAPSVDVTFDIATQNNTATANSDYLAKSLTGQIIPAGSQTYTFTVTVNGDAAIEPDETFFVNVTNASGANVTDGQGIGTIHNDDLPTLSISDVLHNEGNSGTTTYSFTVSLSAPAPAVVTFDIATQDNTATIADNDYVARTLTGQTIPQSNQTYTFDVTVNGDLTIEPDETFFVNVTNVSGATISNSQGLGTIQNDDSPVLSINDVIKNEGNSGTTIFTFTVSLLQPAPVGGVTFDISTADGTAQDDHPVSEDNDYVAKSLTGQTIPQDSQIYTFDVTVNGDTVPETDETFFVNLTNVTGASIADGQGVGTITNDDGATVVISQVYGGGSNGGATYNSDYVELFNRSNAAVNITGWSIQYQPATTTGAAGGTPWTVVALCPVGTCTIPAHAYYLVRLTTPGATGAALPTPDSMPTTTINISATAGKLALVNSTTALVSPSGSGCPSSFASVVDFVGYGTGASGTNCFEGSGAAPTINATSADFRKSTSAGGTNGCFDTNNNNTDFATATPAPRNSSTTNSCP